MAMKRFRVRPRHHHCVSFIHTDENADRQLYVHVILCTWRAGFCVASLTRGTDTVRAAVRRRRVAASSGLNPAVASF